MGHKRVIKGLYPKPKPYIFVSCSCRIRGLCQNCQVWIGSSPSEPALHRIYLSLFLLSSCFPPTSRLVLAYPPSSTMFLEFGVGYLVLDLFIAFLSLWSCFSVLGSPESLESAGGLPLLLYRLEDGACVPRTR